MENLNVTVDLPVICTRGMLVFVNGLRIVHAAAYFQDMNYLWM